MGHSARWHDPAFLDELDRQERMAAMRDVQLLGLGMGAMSVGGGGSVGMMVTLLRRVWRVHEELQRRRRAQS